MTNLALQFCVVRVAVHTETLTTDFALGAVVETNVKPPFIDRTVFVFIPKVLISMYPPHMRHRSNIGG